MAKYTAVALGALAGILALGALGASAQGRQDGGAKIGIVNLQEVADRSQIGIDSQTRILNFFETKRDELAVKESRLQSDSANLENQRSVLSEEAYQQRSNELESRALALQQERDQAERQLQQMRDEELTNFAREVEPVIKALGRELGFTVILDLSSGVHYFDENIEVTDLVVERLNTAQNEQ